MKREYTFAVAGGERGGGAREHTQKAGWLFLCADGVRNLPQITLKRENDNT